MTKISILQKLEKYLKKTPTEQIIEDWKSTKEFDNVGITVEDFLKIHKQMNIEKKYNIQSVVGSTVTEVKTRQLEPFEFYCSNCKTIHKKTTYAIAQAAMNVRLVFTCTCGNKINL